MTMRSLTRVIAAGAVTGMRSMAGAAALALDRGGAAARILPALAAAEMVADKMPFVPDRIAPLPLTGRAVLGAVVGGLIAAEAPDGRPWAGACLGAAAAVASAHLAYHARRRVPLPGAVAGLLEDALVVALAQGVGRPGRAGV